MENEKRNWWIYVKVNYFISFKFDFNRLDVKDFYLIKI